MSLGLRIRPDLHHPTFPRNRKMGFLQRSIHSESTEAVVMGQDEVARLITPESTNAFLLPETIPDGLSFNLGI
jgi:hypothetical protein